MNPDKLKKLQEQVRIGGKGTPRRKKKVVHATAATDDKKLQSCLKKLSVNTIPGIEEVNMIKDDGTVIHFNNPKAQASLSANTFAITGHSENRQITDMLPSILSQLGPEGLTQLKQLASSVARGNLGKMTYDEDDDIPDLIDNFDEASKEEVALGKKKEETPAAVEKDKPAAKPVEVKESKESKDSTEVKSTKESKDTKESKENKSNKAPKEPKEPKQPKEPKEPKESKSAKEPKAPKEKGPKETKTPKDAKATKDSKESKATKKSA